MQVLFLNSMLLLRAAAVVLSTASVMLETSPLGRRNFVLAIALFAKCCVQWRSEFVFQARLQLRVPFSLPTPQCLLGTGITTIRSSRIAWNLI